MVEFRFFTGVRTSEMAGLQWRAVDLAMDKRSPNRRHATVAIREVIVSGEDKETTKTNVARLIRLNTRALAALQRQHKHSQMAGSYVFLDPVTGNPWRQERVFRRRCWEPTLKALGIRYRKPNTMRHTYATRMLMAGMTPKFCALQMGHDVEVFLRTYAAQLPGEAGEIGMRRLETAMSGFDSGEESAAN